MAYTTFPSDSCQQAAILKLWERNLPEASADRYDWLYAAGPASSWLVQADAGPLIGAIGVMDRQVKLFGYLRRAGQAIDLNVDKEHRAVGPALDLQRALIAQVKDRKYSFLYGFPNAQAEGILKRVGYQVLAEVGRWVKPLSIDRSLEPWLPSRLLRAPISLALDSALRLISPETRYCRPDGLSVFITDNFDSRFDALWEISSGQFSVIGQRTSDYLRWRFHRDPDARHCVLCLADSRGRLVAYLVYRCHGGTAYLSDFLFAEPRYFDLVLAEFIRLMRDERVAQITTVYIGSSLVERSLARFGFHRRASAWRAMVYADPDHFGGHLARLLDSQAWFLTRADIDTDF